MINLSPLIIAKLRTARREAKLAQSILAAEVGCKQSALSMFEQGDGTKLNDEVIEKIAKKFGIKLVEEKSGGESVNLATRSVLMASNLRGFCPNPRCPTNHPFSVEDRNLWLPNREEADPVGGKFCAYCGEVLEKHCPNCGAAVHDGAVCSICGEPYISAC